MKRKFEQWYSIIPPISTKWATTSDFNLLNIKKTTTYDVGNPSLYLGQSNSTNVSGV